MRTVALPLVAALLSLSAINASAQSSLLDRLPGEAFDVMPPSAWVQGTPGRMAVHPQECRDLPPTEVRRRIVDVVVQEWAFFGFPVLDRVDETRLLPPGATSNPNRPAFEPTANSRRAPLLNDLESARVAASIGGYWAATPEGAAIVEGQNRAWNGRGGMGARWIAPWSAAFVSWVMCEAGLGTTDRFRRAIAHHAYIDQAIRARDGNAPGAAFVAHDIGEETIEPGDLLCSGRRPEYRSLAERRRQMGAGAGTHCDIVVLVDDVNERILAIGGNVLRAVSLKVLPAVHRGEGGLQPRTAAQRPLFAHLKLQADAVEPDAMAHSPTFNGVGCEVGIRPSSRADFVIAALAMEPTSREMC